MPTSASTPGPAAVEEPSEQTCLVSVVIPCLNEAENIEQCVHTALAAMAAAGIPRAR